MNQNGTVRGIIYIHMSHSDQCVLTSGIEFREFLSGIPIDLSYLLLLRHKFEDTHFNMHTMLEYVDGEGIQNLSKEDVYGYGDFCWMDFSHEEGLNLLTKQEMAEILYLGHFKDHLSSPFYNKLRNNFVYLAGDDGRFNKTYYRSWDTFYTMLGSVMASKVNDKREFSLFQRRKKKEVPVIPGDILIPLADHMKEGIVVSVEKAVRSRQSVEIPFWVVGDYYDMDAMNEEYDVITNEKKPSGKIVFDRKAGEWQAFANYVAK